MCEKYPGWVVARTTLAGLKFLSDEAILKYNRNGGCFVTTKKAIAFVVFALGSLAAVILVMYYYGPNRGEKVRYDAASRRFLV
ncbi:unnamed protein product [Acanthoscelides obtectus]|uniref:Uncharacterized protein n=1 Tax=Acanthoscelides obtectus TaxID=200917 RepID=A0A9P0LVL0_ACAOB|nr:unnamed protein product [Acanthoscelides obtectus]CAK1630245.1 hypothetical protein AOBTE_LOCUS6224 [Acanthoscelides obtectus]